MIVWYQFIGVAGFVTYTAAYFLLQLGRINGNGTCYSWLNLAGASFVLTNVYFEFNLAAALINITWILTSLIGILKAQHKEDAAIGPILTKY